MVTNALKFTHSGFVKVKAYILNLPYLESCTFKSAKEDLKPLHIDLDEEENKSADDDMLKSSGLLSDINIMTSSFMSDFEKRRTTFIDGT